MYIPFKFCHWLAILAKSVILLLLTEMSFTYNEMYNPKYSSIHFEK